MLEGEREKGSRAYSGIISYQRDYSWDHFHISNKNERRCPCKMFGQHPVNAMPGNCDAGGPSQLKFWSIAINKDMRMKEIILEQVALV